MANDLKTPEWILAQGKQRWEEYLRQLSEQRRCFAVMFDSANSQTLDNGSQNVDTESPE